MLVIVILQTRVAHNNTIEKLMAITPQAKVASNNVLEESLIDTSVRSQLNDPTKTLTNS